MSGDERPTQADRIAADLGHAAGRKLAIMDVREYIEAQDLTRLERYELALSLLDDLNYETTEPWLREASTDRGEDE